MRPIYESRKEDLSFSRTTGLTAVKHLHAHVELIVMLEGEVEAFADNKGGLLTPGHAFIAFPNQVHYYSMKCAKVETRMFIFSPDVLPALYPTFRDRTPVYPILPFDREVLLPVLNALDAESHGHDRYSRSVVEGGLSILLAQLFRQSEWTNVDRRNISALRAILDYCNQHYTTDISLEDVAKNTHRSKYYISHVFSNEIGTSFPAYINMLRIHDAKDLLRAGELSVTEVAYAVGFSSLRSFNRSFLALTGHTPSQFKREFPHPTV